jgi:glycerol-3-phosphate dehydrogenase
MEMKEEIKEENLDLIVIGGGITGAGIALDAASRGMKTALVDMQDFAAGTSSRSTKLIHGGLRYLKQFEVNVVSETGKERAIVYENGPHVTTPEWMMLPFYKGGTYGPRLTSFGLRLYDFLAGVKEKERKRMFTREEALSREPLLKEKDLVGAGFYVEYKTDDGRLTIEVLKKAVEYGAIPLNYMKVIDMIYEDNKVSGVKVEDQIDGSYHVFNAKKVINAAGPWVDTLREMDQSKEGKQLMLSKGIHLVFDRTRFPLKQAIYYDTPDGRMIFSIPREGKTYVGTTDTAYEGDIAHPKVTQEDRDYLLKAIDYMFPEVGVTENDVESSWAGLRPLIYEEGKDLSEISRKDEIFISESGLISIAGGKLTGYRKMAERIVDSVVNQLQEEDNILFQHSETKELPISGGEVGGAAHFPSFKAEKVEKGKALGIPEEILDKLVQRYGSNIDCIYALYNEVKSNSTKREEEILVLTILHYAIRYESAYKPTDFFIRRTGALFFDMNGVKRDKDLVIDEMADYLNWSQEQRQAYTIELEEAIYDATHPALSE